MNKQAATRIKDSNDYRYRGIRIYVCPARYRGMSGNYYVRDIENPRIVLEDGTIYRPRVAVSSLASAKLYIDRCLDAEAQAPKAE